MKRCAICWCPKNVHDYFDPPEVKECFVCGCPKYEYNPEKLAKIELCAKCEHPMFWHHENGCEMEYWSTRKANDLVNCPCEVTGKTI